MSFAYQIALSLLAAVVLPGCQTPGDEEGLLSIWLYGSRLQPTCTSTVDPAALPQETTHEGTKYRFPNGWDLLLGDGLRISSSLPDDRAFVYQDNSCIVVLDGGSQKPRVLYRARLKNGKAHAPTWSPDGRYWFGFFDCMMGVVAVEAMTGELTPLVSFPVHRDYKGGFHFKPMICEPFVFDSGNDGSRLVYVEQDYGEPYEARLSAIALSSAKRSALSEKGLFRRIRGRWSWGSAPDPGIFEA